jgi:phenylacetate-coenzyme A ligase PaaK-like adenylate-forming protein
VCSSDLHGVADDARLVNLTSPVCLGTSCPGDVARLTDKVLLLTFGAGLFEASDAMVSRVARAFNEFAADIAFVNPVWLHWLHRRASALGLHLTPPRLVALTYQYPSRCQRRALARAFPDVPQVEFYGASEFGGTDLAIGCPAGHLHVVDYQAYAEALPSAVEGHDELVFTTPRSRTMPLVRYAPGDLGRLGWVDEQACPLWRVATLELDGRVTDVMHSTTRVVTTREFDDLVGDLEGLLFYEARANGGVLTMRAICEPPSARAVEHAVEGIAQRLGFSRLEFLPVERLSLGASGKLRLTGDDDRHALERR